MPYNVCTKCPTLIPMGTSRCAKHRRKTNKISPRLRGYTTEYDKKRAAILAASNICWLCGKHGANTVDHVIPLSHGGTNDISNLKPAHKRCNSSRGNRPAR
jgi:5-methylcytosine-specific restriction protein A